MFFDYLQGQLSDCRQIDSSEAFSGPASVLKEVYIRIPVQLVFYRPVPRANILKYAAFGKFSSLM